MKAITFKNTCINFPGWPKDLHLTHNQGYAYALPTHYVYLCGKILLDALCLTSNRIRQQLGVLVSASLWSYELRFDGIRRRQPQSIEVWRPARFYNPKDLQSALAFNDEEASRAGQALRLLVARLDEILLFIEPDAKFLQAYGHKTRDLLIAACTEVENYFQRYMASRRDPDQRKVFHG